MVGIENRAKSGWQAHGSHEICFGYASNSKGIDLVTIQLLSLSLSLNDDCIFFIVEKGD